jgi:hypothetical protein
MSEPPTLQEAASDLGNAWDALLRVTVVPLLLWLVRQALLASEYLPDRRTALLPSWAFKVRAAHDRSAS